MTGEIINESELRKAIMVLKPKNQLFECRVIYSSKKVYSGYFRDVNTLINAFNDIPDFANCNIYMTLNTLNDQCYDRAQKDRFIANADATTSDNDVIGYDWLFVDIDPKRPTKTSSTKEQIEMSRILCEKIRQFLTNVGFEQPVVGFSGNGYHMLYKIHIKTTEERRRLVEQCMKTLAMMFSDEYVDVDVKNYNPARVCKLYGTRAQKGVNSENAPHRMSKILMIPEEIKITKIEYLQKLADYYPKEEEPQRYNNYRPRDFDLDSWLAKYNVMYRKDHFSGGDKYILDHCPFDANHKGKDAVIFKLTNGALGFNCFHNSCADKTWRDVRQLFEPDAYEKKHREYEKRIYSKSRVPEKIEKKEGEPLWFTAMDIFNLQKPDEKFIRTGTTGIDKRLRGLKIGATSVLSGLRGSAKSTWLSGLVLECCQNGNKVGVYSGELSADGFMRWINLQAAGKANVEPTQYQNYYMVSKKNEKLIAEWMNDNFHLYNNKYGNDFSQLKDEFRQKIENDNLDLLILDNLMAFDISGLADNKYEAQTAFTWTLHELARDYHCHIMFVAHPRKAMGFLRLDDISGTADIGNAVDNAFIIHRNNNDFRRLSKATFGWKDDNPIYQCTNVIEIAKDRDGGNQDIFIPLWYEQETKRMKNEQTENKIYGWDVNSNGFVSIPQSEDIVFD